MAITEQTIEAERIEILEDGSLQVRDATLILRDGLRDTSFAPRFSRYVLHPGESLEGKPDKVAAVAAAVWTEDVVETWQAAHAGVEP